MSDFNNQSQGSPLPVDVLRIAAAPDGTAIWALDEDGGTGGRGALITIDRVSDRVRGLRRPESNFGRGEPRGVDPNGLAFVASGDLLVADPIDHRGGALFLVDALNGSRRVVSNFANEDQCTDPDRTKCRATMAIDVAIDPAGGVLVIDQAGGPLRPPVQVGRGTVVRVSPFDGMRTVLSDFRDLAVEELNDNSHYFCFTQRSGVVVRSSIPCLTSVAFTKKPILRSREIQ